MEQKLTQSKIPSLKSSKTFLSAKAGSPPTLTAHVFARLRDAIVAGRYKPGDRLNESQLARDFQISRIPVREALMQLEEQGLVMNQERRGMFVTTLSDEDVQHINSIRVVLEAEALKLCQLNMTKKEAKRLTALVDQMESWEESTELHAASVDLQFHRGIWSASGNPYLVKTLDTLATALFAHKALDNVSAETKKWRLHHHRGLLNVALGESDMTPEEAMIDHLRTGYTDPERFSSYAAQASSTEKETKTTSTEAPKKALSRSKKTKKSNKTVRSKKNE